jgi:hypothetical protein
MQPTGQPPGQPPAGAAAPPNPAMTVGIILCVCAAALLIALFTKGWATASEGGAEIGAGLLGFEGCGRGQCESVEWDKGEKMLDIPGDIGAVRIFALLAGLAALGGIGAAGGLALARKTDKIPLKPIQMAMGIASGLLTWFTVRMSMADDDVNFGPGFSAILGIGGLIAAGIVMQTMLRPLVQKAKAAAPGLPVAQAMGAPGAAPGPAPGPCPKCGGQLQFVAPFQRWFCTAGPQYG